MEFEWVTGNTKLVIRIACILAHCSDICPRSHGFRGPPSNSLSMRLFSGATTVSFVCALWPSRARVPSFEPSHLQSCWRKAMSYHPGIAPLHVDSYSHGTHTHACFFIGCTQSGKWQGGSSLANPSPSVQSSSLAAFILI